MKGAIYHSVIGVSHFYIYDNESTDDTREILRAAEKAGLCSVYNWPRLDGKDRPQFRAYAHFLKTHRDDCDWVAVLDADEFINLKRHVTIQDFLAEYPEADAIGINWRMFGDSGQEHYSPEPLMVRFTKAAADNFGGNNIIKTIARTHSVVELGIHSHKLKDGAQFLNPEGRPLKPYPAGRQDYVSLDVAQINHYYTKTREEWAIKQRRGKADLWEGHDNFKREDSEFTANNRNEVVDETIQTRLEPALKAMRLLFD
jgi:glycosyltransferase involved in cell wall biosynthesis